MSEIETITRTIYVCPLCRSQHYECEIYNDHYAKIAAQECLEHCKVICDAELERENKEGEND